MKKLVLFLVVCAVALTVWHVAAKPELGTPFAASEPVDSGVLTEMREWVSFDFIDGPYLDRQDFTLVIRRDEGTGAWFVRDWWIVGDWGVCWKMRDVEGHLMGEQLWCDHPLWVGVTTVPIYAVRGGQYQPGRLGQIEVMAYYDARFKPTGTARLELHSVEVAATSTSTATATPTPTLTVMPTPTATPSPTRLCVGWGGRKFCRPVPPYLLGLICGRNLPHLWCE